MARPTKSERLARLHDEALRQFDEIQAACRDVRMQCLEDRRFAGISGAQWEGAWGDQFESKPKIEVNRVAPAVMRIINEFRNSRIDVDFISKEGEEYDDLADLCDDLYRADCQDSCAEEAHDNAFDEGVTGGFGAFRLRSEYEDEYDEENDRQRIRIEPIFDADSTVFFDLNSRKQDKSDAKYCFVLVPMTVEAYKEEYGDDPATWPKEIEKREFDWCHGDSVYVAEYYRVEEASETVITFVDVAGVESKYRDSELTEEKMAELAAVGAKETARRKVKTRKVRKYLMSGGGVLSDDGYIAGKHIPIVPFFGQRYYIDGVERCRGHVRLLKDPARIENVLLSKLVDIAASASVSKPILVPEQVAGHETMWERDAIVDYPFLLLNPVTANDGSQAPSGPVGYTNPAEVPPPLAALLQYANQAVTDLSGNQQAGEELQPNLSGKAVELIQTRLDMQSFIYMSNFSKAIRRSGEIWLSMASELYVEEGRKMKGVRSDGEMDQIVINEPVLDEETGEVEYRADLSSAKFDVAVDVGPSSSSRRAAVVRALTGMMSIAPDPQTQAVLGAAAMMNMEGEGLGSLRKFFRRQLVNMGVEEPTDKEAEEMALAAQNAQPDPNAQLALAMAGEAQAKAMKAQADTEYAIARTQEAKANALETLAGIDNARQEQVLKTAETLARVTSATQPPGVTG